MNIREVARSAGMDDLMTLAARLHALATAGDYDALEAPELVDQLMEAVVSADRYLTGRADNRGHDRASAEALLTGELWEVYLSDGGYSRVMVQIADPESPSCWLDRGLSLPAVVERWDTR